MSLEEYRASPREILRTNDLLRLTPIRGETALDVGARDGYFSRLLAKRFSQVTALDLMKPAIHDERIQCVEGNLLELKFQDGSFDFVLCAEVLEHIPCNSLEKACRELSRVTKKNLLIGVPYKQDLRLHRTTCRICGTRNPPWGHVNSFDEARLMALFPNVTVTEISYVGKNNGVTNAVSAALMDLAGNPFGTYGQEEPCINCGNKITPPDKRNTAQRIATRVAHLLTSFQQHFTPSHANWIHILFSKP